MTHLAAPAQPLTDGVLTLRLPSPTAGDIDTVRGYIGQDQLDDAWLPGTPLGPAEQAIGDWLNGWAGRPSRDGPVFVVTIPEEPRFIGIIGLGDSVEDLDIRMPTPSESATLNIPPGVPPRPRHPEQL
jgi:hypothetical protein